MTTSSQCSFTSSVNPTTGYHTAYTTEYSGDFVEGCSLHLAYTLPPDVFVDPYELRYDINAFELQPLPNLELPVKVASYNTSILTIQLDTSSSTSNGGRTPTVKIPVHARYGEPSPLPTSPSKSESSYHTIQLTAPRGYWSCPKLKLDQEGTEAAETRDAKDAIDIIECSSTFVLDDAPAKQQNVDVVTLRIPVGSRRDLDLVELSTTVVVLGLLVYLLWVFWNTARRITSTYVVEKNQ